MVAKYNKNENRDRSSLVFSVILGILFFTVVGFLVGSNIMITKKRADLSVQLEDLKKEYQDLQQKKDQLQAQVSQSGSQDYLEEQARENFNLKKPGEEVVTVLPPEAKTQPETKKETKWWNPFTW